MSEETPAPPFVLNAVEFNGPRFDQPAQPVLSKLFLCSSQRTGSFLLCRAMVHHGLGIPHEYWNPRHISELAPRFGVGALSDGHTAASDAALRGSYIKAVTAHRTVDGIFAAKIQWWEYRDYLDNAEGEGLLRGARFVHLYREDLLDQAISLHLSHLTGRWGLDATITTVQPPTANFYDVSAIERRLDEMADADRNWRLFFAHRGIRPLTVSYEQLIGGAATIVHRIAEAFQLMMRGVPDYAEARVPITRDPLTPSATDIREWYLAQRR